MSQTLIAQHHHPLGGYFLACSPDQTYLAGRTEQHASCYRNPQALYDAMYPLAASGHHWAWNLCYEAQALLDTPSSPVTCTDSSE